MSDLVPDTDGSNNSYSNYVNVQTYGFDEGIQVGGEHVVCINCGATGGRYVNMKRVERQTPGGKLGDLMREVYPGTWRGSIDFTLQPDWCCTNSVDCPIWENDGEV